MRDLLVHAEGIRSGETAKARSGCWVLVLDGRVVHCASRPPDAVPEGTPRGEGGWLVEPLADAHVHLCLSGSFSPRERRLTALLSREEALARILELLEAYRRRGVAVVRDGGDPHGLVAEAAGIALRCPERFAAVLPAGEPLFRRGCYGSFLGTGVEGVEEGLERLRRARETGARHIKILATGLNSVDEAGVVGPASFAPEELRVLLAEARRLGLPSMIHANGPLDGLGGAPGPDATLEHGFGLDGADPQRLAASGTPWTPTAAAWAALIDHPEFTPAQRDVVRRTDERHGADVRRGRAAGVRILVGSDAGTPGVGHGLGLKAELGRLMRYGLSGEQALAAARRSCALCERELGRPLGGLAVGGEAGFVHVREDPAQDLEALDEPLGVWLGGRWTPVASEGYGAGP
ncbi:MAG: amidohydrolase family protein [Deltaproteobacteria bacterium]|nr:amidohydrolase family protein [Deltaproteobacteria bacterium]